MSNSYHFIDVRPISGIIGAEIYGIDLKKEINADKLMNFDWHLLTMGYFFRDQNLSPEQEIAFAERWEKININRFITNIEGYKQIGMILK